MVQWNDSEDYNSSSVILSELSIGRGLEFSSSVSHLTFKNFPIGLVCEIQMLVKYKTEGPNNLMRELQETEKFAVQFTSSLRNPSL